MTDPAIDYKLTARQADLLKILPRALDEQQPADIRLPASLYCDPEIFEREQERVFFKSPIAVAPSAVLPEINNFKRIEFLKQQILLTRAKDGVARAFINVCRHRGTILCPEKDGQKGLRVVCPYHAWSYSLDGKLAGVPRKDFFVDLDTSAHSLIALPCREAGGMIWIGLRADSAIDFNDVADLASDLDSIGMNDQRIYAARSYDLRCNWKMVMDGMMDNYHVTRLHRNSLGRYFNDVPNLIRPIGPHLLSMAARGNFDQNDSTRLGEIRRHVVMSYIAFPSTIVVLSPDYINVVIVEPVSTNRCKVEYFMLVNTGSTASEERLQKSFSLMDRVFGQEDFWVAELGQAGLETGALKELMLGGQEIEMYMFHQTLADRLAAA